jgi:hypothetical protein
LETHEPNCVPREAKPFFILMVHSASGGRGTRGDTGAPFSGRQILELWDTWQHRNSPRQGGKIRSRGTHGSIGAHLSNEVRSGASGHVVTLEPTSVGRCGPKLHLRTCMRGYPVFRVLAEAPGPTSGVAANPQVRPTNSSAHRSVILNFFLVCRRWTPERSGSAHHQR